MWKKNLEFEDGNKLASSLCGLKYEDLFRYFSVIGKYHFLEKKIFKDGVWDEFSKKGKELAKQLEVEKSIKYKEYREEFGRLIEEYTKEEVHEKLILLVRETYGSKDEDSLYEVAKTIFKD